MLPGGELARFAKRGIQADYVMSGLDHAPGPLGHTAATGTRDSDALNVMRSHVISFSVSLDIGRNRCTAFRAMAQVTTRDQFAQFFERVKGCVRERRGGKDFRVEGRRQLSQGRRKIGP